MMRRLPGRMLRIVFLIGGVGIYAGCMAPHEAPLPEAVVSAPEQVRTEPQADISEFVMPSDLPQESGPEFFQHTISREGETLMGISGWYTGSSSNWKRILDANPGLDPNRLQLGSVIDIPAELVKKTTPMPGSLIKQREASQKSASTGTSRKDPEAIKLFSPDDIGSESEAIGDMQLFGPPE